MADQTTGDQSEVGNWAVIGVSCWSPRTAQPFLNSDAGPRSKRGWMLKIQRSSNGQVIFTLSGEMEEEQIAELEALISSEAKGLRIIFDLKDLTLVNENAISFLERCETNSITLKNCPAYIREWITRQRQTGLPAEGETKKWLPIQSRRPK